MRAFFKNRHNPRLPLAYAFGNELSCQDRFSGSRRPCHQYTIAFGNAPAQHLVQLRNTEAKAPAVGRMCSLPGQAKSTREGLQPSTGNAEVCSPGTEACPRSFMICSFRTTEFRSAACLSQKRPSATVKIGLSRISSSAYSPIRKVVACQLARN